MTVSVQTPFTAATANGVTTVFPYAFRIIDQADLDVTLDGVLQTTGFTVSGIGDDIGGNVTFDVAPASGVAVLMARDPVLERETDYAQFGKIPSDILNADFDRLWLALQYIKQLCLTAIKLPFATPVDQIITEDAAARMNTVIGFDASGDLRLYTDIEQSIIDANAAADAAAASAASISIGTPGGVCELDGSAKVPNSRLDPELAAIASLTSAVNMVPRFTGSGTADLVTMVSGTWTPTIVNSTNATAIYYAIGIYSRVGSIVTFSLRVNCTLTNPAVYGSFTFSLPIPSAMTSNADLIGSVCGLGNSRTVGVTGEVYADYGNDVGLVFALYNTTIATGVSITGQYIIK